MSNQTWLQIALIGMCFFFGWAFSSLFIPRLSDIHGRKIAFLGCMILQTVSMTFLNFSTSVELTTALMFFFGMACVGSRALGFLYLMEMLPKKWQVPAGTLLTIADTCIPVLEVIYFWKVDKNWIYFVIIFGEAIGVVVIICGFMMPDSPKYLITAKRYQEARNTVNFFSQGRKFKGKFDREMIDYKGKLIKSSPQLNENDMTSLISFIDNDKVSFLHQKDSAQLREQVILDEKALAKEEAQLTGTLGDLVKVRRHFINLLILLYAWIASSFDYYLVNIIIKYLPGDIFQNALTTNIADIPIALLAGLIYHKLGLKASLSGAFVVAACGGLALVLFSQAHQNAVPIMVLFAKGGVKMTFNIVFFANSQIFPTIFAGTAFGLCNLGAKIATIFSPYMAEVDPPVPMIVFTVLAVSASIMSLLINTKPIQQAKPVKPMIVNQVD